MPRQPPRPHSPSTVIPSRHGSLTEESRERSNERPDQIEEETVDQAQHVANHRRVEADVLPVVGDDGTTALGPKARCGRAGKLDSCRLGLRGLVFVLPLIPAQDGPVWSLGVEPAQDVGDERDYEENEGGYRYVLHLSNTSPGHLALSESYFGGMFWLRRKKFVGS
jgi:hypothetical protein